MSIVLEDNPPSTSMSRAGYRPLRALTCAAIANTLCLHNKYHPPSTTPSSPSPTSALNHTPTPFPTPSHTLPPSLSPSNPSHLWHHILHELLSPKPWLYCHDQNHVHLVHERQDIFHRCLRLHANTHLRGVGHMRGGGACEKGDY